MFLHSTGEQQHQGTYTGLPFITGARRFPCLVLAHGIIKGFTVQKMMFEIQGKRELIGMGERRGGRCVLGIELVSRNVFYCPSEGCLALQKLQVGAFLGIFLPQEEQRLNCGMRLKTAISITRLPRTNGTGDDAISLS